MLKNFVSAFSSKRYLHAMSLHACVQWLRLNLGRPHIRGQQILLFSESNLRFVNTVKSARSNKRLIYIRDSPLSWNYIVIGNSEFKWSFEFFLCLLYLFLLHPNYIYLYNIYILLHPNYRLFNIYILLHPDCSFYNIYILLHPTRSVYIINQS